MKPCELYRHFDKEGRLLYVGISSSTVLRLRQHKNASHWYDQIARIEIERFPSRKAAHLAETEAITTEGPLFNIRLDGSGWLRRRPTSIEKILLLQRAKELGIPVRGNACLSAIKHTMEAIERGDLETAKASTAWGNEMDWKYRDRTPVHL